MPPVQVTRTYLEMTSPEQLRPVDAPDPLPRIERLADCPITLFRFLYAEVGRACYWRDRLSWSDKKVRDHLATPGVSLWLLSWEATPAGYFELKRHDDDSMEIAYFGLLPDFFGRGWGKYLLSEAVRSAWSFRPTKVWLHTCTLDHPAALPNYLQRGFQPVRQETYMADTGAAAYS